MQVCLGLCALAFKLKIRAIWVKETPEGCQKWSLQGRMVNKRSFPAYRIRYRYWRMCTTAPAIKFLLVPGCPSRTRDPQKPPNVLGVPSSNEWIQTGFRDQKLTHSSAQFLSAGPGKCNCSDVVKVKGAQGRRRAMGNRKTTFKEHESE